MEHPKSKVEFQPFHCYLFHSLQCLFKYSLSSMNLQIFLMNELQSRATLAATFSIGVNLRRRRRAGLFNNFAAALRC